jgi:quercetin dioxygenase-like cupin family protein
VKALALALPLVIACGPPTASTPTTPPPMAGSGSAVVTIDAAAATQDEQLAAIQKAMNELYPAAQACWAAVAVERFDIEGELAAQIDIAQAGAKATFIRDTTKSPKLAACVTGLLEHYPWAPPLAGQSIQLPFKFTAPEGQSVIDRRFVPFAGQGKVSIAVLLDENNTGNAAVSMFEVAIAAGGTTGMRSATRAELWYFLGDGEVSGFGPKGKTAVHKGDMIYAPQGSAREVSAAADMHAVVIVAPGGREGTARAGALPTPEVTSVRSAPQAPFVILHADAKPYDMHRIFVEPATVPYAILSASEAELPAGLAIKEHVHAKETEVLYILDGEGTMTIGGLELAIGPTSVVQVPPNTKHAFTAKRAVRALQIYTPAGPEQRFKGKS